MEQAIMLFGQLALLLAGVTACVGFLVVIISGVSWSVKQVKKLSRL
jgi:hypothetical protein